MCCLCFVWAYIDYGPNLARLCIVWAYIDWP